MKLRRFGTDRDNTNGILQILLKYSFEIMNNETYIIHSLISIQFKKKKKRITLNLHINHD